MNLTELHKKYGTQNKCMLNYKPVGDTKQIAYGKRKTKKCLS